MPWLPAISKWPASTPRATRCSHDKLIAFIHALPNSLGRKCRGLFRPVYQVKGVLRVSGSNDPDQILPKVGDAIRRARRKVGLSQEALADASMIDRSHLGRIERGERNLTVLNLKKIANALDCSASELLGLACV